MTEENQNNKKIDEQGKAKIDAAQIERYLSIGLTEPNHHAGIKNVAVGNLHSLSWSSFYQFGVAILSK